MLKFAEFGSRLMFTPKQVMAKYVLRTGGTSGSLPKKL